MKEQEYLEKRLDDQLSYYAAKGNINKKKYLNTRITLIVLSASLPFITQVESPVAWISMKYLIGIIGVLITVISGIEGLFQYKEEWLLNRKMEETLKREKILYLTHAGEYRRKVSFKKFVERVEGILAEENAEWYNIKKQSGVEDDDYDDDEKEDDKPADDKNE